MSCRDTAGSSAITSYARVRSGVGDEVTQVEFHRLRREGRRLVVAGPTAGEAQEFYRRQLFWVQHDPLLTPVQRTSLGRRLARALDEPPPDGPTFYAMRNLGGRLRQLSDPAAACLAAEDLERDLGWLARRARWEEPGWPAVARGVLYDVRCARALLDGSPPRVALAEGAGAAGAAVAEARRLLAGVRRDMQRWEERADGADLVARGRMFAAYRHLYAARVRVGRGDGVVVPAPADPPLPGDGEGTVVPLRAPRTVA